MPGRCVSTSATANGSPPVAARRSSSKARSPLSATDRTRPHSRAISPSASRWVALSSTTSSRRPRSTPGTPLEGAKSALAAEAAAFAASPTLAALAAAVAPAGRAVSKRAVKWNVLPLPGSLSTHSRPPIIATSWEQIARPSPVPP